MTDQTQTQEPSPRGAKDLGTRDSPAWQHKKKTNKTKQNASTSFSFVTRFFSPFRFFKLFHGQKKLILCNIDFHDIQLTHHAKDLDWFFFFPMIPSFPKPVSVRD